ncbi:hypothetical protein V1509DRAFT_622556 [Lipomyces kononenkoae]
MPATLTARRSWKITLPKWYPSHFLPPRLLRVQHSRGMFRASPPNNAWTFALPAPETVSIPLFDTPDTGQVR